MYSYVLSLTAKKGRKKLSELYFRSLIKSNAQPERLNSLRSNSSRFEAVSLTLIAHSNRLGRRQFPSFFLPNGGGLRWGIVLPSTV